MTPWYEHKMTELTMIRYFYLCLNVAICIVTWTRNYRVMESSPERAPTSKSDIRFFLTNSQTPLRLCREGSLFDLKNSMNVIEYLSVSLAICLCFPSFKFACSHLPPFLSTFWLLKNCVFWFWPFLIFVFSPFLYIYIHS